MHLAPRNANKMGDKEANILLYAKIITEQSSIKSLGRLVDRKLSFKEHASHASSKLHPGCGLLWRITKQKGVTPSALHTLAMAVTIPAMLWGSQLSWTSPPHLLTCIAPADHMIVCIITGLPKWTSLKKLLPEAGIPPLDLLLDLQ